MLTTQPELKSSEQGGVPPKLLSRRTPISLEDLRSLRAREDTSDETDYLLGLMADNSRPDDEEMLPNPVLG